MSEEPFAEKDAGRCAGLSAKGACPAPVRYVVAATAPDRKYAACGRHISWLLDVVLSDGERGTVTRISPPSGGER